MPISIRPGARSVSIHSPKQLIPYLRQHTDIIGASSALS